MGIILGISFIVTFFVLFLQISIANGALLAISFVIYSLILKIKTIDKIKLSKLFRYYSYGVFGVSCLFFTITYTSYINYSIITWSTPETQKESIINNYWKNNLKHKTVGTISLFDPMFKFFYKVSPKDNNKDGNERVDR